MAARESTPATGEPALQFSRESILRDYRIAYQSREASLLGRKEVLTGKAKFGIFGDGKEVAQVAMARAFRQGDFRSGYYRDQTFMLALGRLRLEEFFAQLYADPDPRREPSSAGRQMNAHFATPLVDGEGAWERHTAAFNSSADLSPTASQMPRLVGLAQASSLYRAAPRPGGLDGFLERRQRDRLGHDRQRQLRRGPVLGVGQRRRRAAGAAAAVDLGRRLRHLGAHRAPDHQGRPVGGAARLPAPAGRQRRLRHLHRARLGLCRAVRDLSQRRRDRPRRARAGDRPRHRDDPAAGPLDLGQPRALQVGRAAGLGAGPRLPAPDAQLDGREGHRRARRSSTAARRRTGSWCARCSGWPGGATASRWRRSGASFSTWPAGWPPQPELAEVATAGRRAAVARRRSRCAAICWRRRRTCGSPPAADSEAAAPARRLEDAAGGARAAGATASTSTPRAPARRCGCRRSRPAYRGDTPLVNGFEVLNRCFDAAFERLPQLVAFGEDVGRLGDVNQGFAGLQERYGELRVADTGIREATIVGQAIGLAMRGLRPIAEIQYLDYLLYALQILSDDLATLRWRTVRRPEGAGHRPHPRPPAGGHLARRLADGSAHQPGARHLPLRAARHDPGGRLLQHAAAVATTRRWWSRCSTATG